MRELLLQTAGWVGYLSRPAVLLQLLALGLGLAAFGHSRRFLKGLPHNGQIRRVGLLVLLALFAGLLALLEWPSQLLVVSLLLIGGWFGLAALRIGLRHRLAPRQLHQLDTGLLRPLYLLLVLLVLVRQVDSPRNLALISMGTWFGSEITAGQLFLAVLVLYVLLMGSGPPTQGVARLVQRLVGVSDTGRRALALVLQYSIVALGILWTLDQLGLNRTGILAVAGGLSVGLGFGVKEVFSNFISGLWLLFEGSVRPGDILFIDGDPCEVRSLGLRAAVLWRDRDNAELVIPNQTFFTTTTTTYTGTDRLRRGQVLVGAAYRHDPETVIAVLEHTAIQVSGVLHEPAPKGLLLSYGDSSINYSLRFWMDDPLRNVGISSAVNTAVWRAFREHGIEIPFPQRVLHQCPAGSQAGCQAGDQPSKP